MTVTLAFDVYGTLIDTHGVVSELNGLIGNKAKNFSHTWREKQLEYSFRRGLMQNYEPFSVCISNALDYTCLFYGIDLTSQQRKNLLECYRLLPAFADVDIGLKKLVESNYRLFAFSNGTANAVNELLVTAGIKDYFQEIISVDDIKSFKPNPAVYSHFLRQSEAKGNSAWLISSNPFDVIGAISAGMRAAWVRRSKSSIYDPWGIEPTITIESLDDLHEKLTNK
ncbi:MAG: haloacid dehalogenase type II [Pseudomonadota bacterium]